MVTTGTGSTGLFKTAQEIKDEAIAKVLKLTGGSELGKKELHALIKDVNDRLVFDPEARKLAYLHRDLVSEEVRKEGAAGRDKRSHWVSSSTLKNKSYKAIFCSDTTEFPIGYDEELSIGICDPTEYLTTIVIPDKTSC